MAQINAQNSSTVIDQLRHVVHDKKIDVICIQEPYSRNNVIAGLGVATKVITDTKIFTRSTTHKTIKAAIAVTNPSYNVLKLEQLSNTHCICIEITTAGYKLYIINAYFQYCDKIEPYLQHIEHILLTLKGRNIILCADANAKSEFWHSNQTDERGELLENFISQHNLFIANSKSQIYTFDNLYHRTNIDVTLANSACFKAITGWKTHTCTTTSDHNLITFNVNAPTITHVKKKSSTARYNLKRADWTKLTDTLEKEITENPTLQRRDLEDPDIAVQELEKAIIRACDTTIPKKTRFAKSTPWWTANLTALRRETRAARRLFQTEKIVHKRNRLRTEYKTLRNKYIAEIRKAKTEAWRKFVTTEGNANTWGIVYKLQTNKITAERAYESIKRIDQQTTTWEETMDALLDTLIPDDETGNETAWHRNVRTDILTLPDTDNTPPFTEEEVGKAIGKLKNGKAPGHDLIEAEIAKATWQRARSIVTNVMNSCLKHGKFPKTWKRGTIRVLLKGQDKDKTDPKSYRPICLLPILSKVLEKLIAHRLDPILNHHQLTARRQYGFKKGTSTQDAIVHLRDTVSQSTHKYVIALLFDISGAFDNVWWPDILHNLKKRNCPRNLYALIRSYLSERTATICSSNNDANRTKTVTKGCPQGSILGPSFWNLIFDDALNTLETLGNEEEAFADDLVVLVSGNSRKQLEERANEVTKTLTTWCTKHKMKLSQTKSEMLLLKGMLDIKRPPTVKVGNSSLRMVPTAKYLGVHLGTRLNITPHVKYVANKSKQVFNKLAHIARAHWGVNYVTMSALYKGVFQPIVTYAAPAWCDKLQVWHRKHLVQAQRHVLLRVTRAYRTISTEALTVIAAATPINLLIEERRAIYLMKSKRAVKIGNLTLEPRDHITKELITEIRKQIGKQIVDMWQTSWDQSTKGRITHKFFGNIERRLKSTWIQPSYYTMQILSGHGQFRNIQKTINVRTDDLCDCSLKDSVEHVIFECTALTTARESLRRNIEAAGIHWPCHLEDLTHQNTFMYLTEFATEAMSSRDTFRANTGRINRSRT